MQAWHGEAWNYPEEDRDPRVDKISTEQICLEICQKTGFDTVYMRSLPHQYTENGARWIGWHIVASFRYKSGDRRTAHVFTTGTQPAKFAPLGNDPNPEFLQGHWNRGFDEIAMERATAIVDMLQRRAAQTSAQNTAGGGAREGPQRSLRWEPQEDAHEDPQRASPGNPMEDPMEDSQDSVRVKCNAPGSTFQSFSLPLSHSRCCILILERSCIFNNKLSDESTSKEAALRNQDHGAITKGSRARACLLSSFFGCGAI